MIRRPIVWIEAALNGPWGRERQHGIPITVEEIIADGIAAAQAGAAIVHLRAYDEQTGRQRDDASLYARIIEGIRARADVIVYPTVPLAGSDYASSDGRRYGHVEALARRGLLEWLVVDPGSVAFVRFGELAGASPGFTYENPLSDLRDGMALAREHRLHPSFAIYEPGFTRLGAALATAMDTPVPIYRLMFSDEFAWGFPRQTGVPGGAFAAPGRDGTGRPVDGGGSWRRYPEADPAATERAVTCGSGWRTRRGNRAEQRELGRTGGTPGPSGRR